ncbi:hypothetical protein Thena_0839 [Thermodesulfobium narugense DSM 14796]|uniref:Glycosyltransferase RgtA/B/C/D-like domain-containing protein n=1 Tax=Thermodesulfobium narugense DSM 14796 TaxID=747365 RepID=M1E7H5_9BACT|nr:hypothetical protein [Thermodesulfobium narugense]AEE14470.1 hypothetical protein Thena_0839 [Thermodesulfobium narugense DSM 14796]
MKGISKRLKKKTFLIIATFLLILTTIPDLVKVFAPVVDTQDTSWAWLLGYAFLNNLQWGKEIIFTFGPLGFLENTYFYSNHLLWFITAIANIFVRLVFYAFFIYFVYLCVFKEKDSSNSQSSITFYFFYVLISAISIIVSSSIPISMLLCLMATLIIVDTFNCDFIKNNKIILIRYVLSGALFAFSSLIKFNVIPFAILFLLVYPFLMVYSFRDKKIFFQGFVGLISFILVFLLIYLIIGQNLSNLPALLMGIYEIIKGYTPAMFLNGKILQTLVAVITLLYFVYLILISYKKKKKILFSQLFLLFLLLFFVFKEGFVRQDNIITGGHTLSFFTVCLILLAFIIFLYSRMKLSNSFINFVFLIIFFFNVIGGIIYINGARNIVCLSNLSFSKHKRIELQQSINSAIRNQFKVDPSILQSIGDQPVTIIPWDLMMSQGYNFKFIPQVVPQAYSAYTPYLDEQNAKQILSDVALQKIIYTFEDIDNRYPLFSEPYTFMTILSCYRTEIAGNKYSLLTRKKSCHDLNLTSISSIETGLNQWIDLPSNADFMDIYINPTLISHIIDILYKPFSQIYISFKLSNNQIVGPYRFIPGVSKDHLFVKYFIRNQRDLNDLMSKDAYNLLKIKSFTITTKGINLDYDKSYNVIFYNSSFS